MRSLKRETPGHSHRRLGLSNASERASVGLALEIRNLVGLYVGPPLRIPELVLGLAFALLLPALAAQACIVGEVARRLLHTSSQLVNDSHFASVVAHLICARAQVSANRLRA